MADRHHRRLHDSGLDVTDADLTIGTSAGATAAAQLGGASPAELFEATLVAPPQRRNRPPRDPSKPVVDYLDRIRTIIASSEDAADMRRRMGSAALTMAADSDGSWQATWRAIVASRLPSQDWPERPVLITAVDARTGEPAGFDRHSGVDLVDAVAASCSSGRPFMIGDNAYIDGGYRSNAENADLAAGYERVLVLSPLGGRSLVPEQWGTHLSTQVEALRTSGSTVETVVPEDDAEHLFGANAMDLSLRPAAARAGHDQGRALAERLSVLWR